jgi:hypothetical protein
MPDVRFLRGQAAADQAHQLGRPHTILLPFFERGFQATLLNGGDCEMELMGLDGDWYPIVINPGTKPECHLHAPSALYIDAAITEIRNADSLPAPLTWLAATGLRAASLLARIRDLDRCIWINNWGHFHSPIPHGPLVEMDRWFPVLQERYPDYAFIYQTPPHHADRLIPALEAHGFDFIPTWEAYYWHPGVIDTLSRNRRQNLRRDLRLLDNLPFEQLTEKDDLSWVDPAEMHHLYRSINIEKHSGANPDLAVAYFENVLREKPVGMDLFRKDGKLIAFSLFDQAPGYINFNLLGHRPIPEFRHPVYRPLTMKCFQRALQSDSLLDMGPGCGEYKSNRGCEARIEQRAVYTRHLSSVRRFQWTLIRILYKLFSGLFFGRVAR